MSLAPTAILAETRTVIENVQWETFIAMTQAFVEQRFDRGVTQNIREIRRSIMID